MHDVVALLEEVPAKDFNTAKPSNDAHLTKYAQGPMDSIRSETKIPAIGAEH